MKRTQHTDVLHGVVGQGRPFAHVHTVCARRHVCLLFAPRQTHQPRVELCNHGGHRKVNIAYTNSSEISRPRTKNAVSSFRDQEQAAVDGTCHQINNNSAPWPSESRRHYHAI